MNEWDLQTALTERWLGQPPEIPPFGRVDLVAWELMFPSWDINYKATRWNEPSLDFVFLSGGGSFVLVELKNGIANRSAFLSAYCQVSHRAVQFARTFSSQKLQKAYECCMSGASNRSAADPALRQGVSDRIRRISGAPPVRDIYRVIAAVGFPRARGSLLDQLNGCDYPELCAVIGTPPKGAKELMRFCAMTAADYDGIRANPVSLYHIDADADVAAAADRPVAL
ncbi:MAG: hypothetical protein ACAI35_24480 [Candidatus Methylacidiphilales bacterium]